MGTNYYYETGSGSACPHCGRFDAPRSLHIGKSSAGWAFSLHIIPEEGIRSLEDWQKRWATGEGRIRDEYGKPVTAADMVTEITQRTHPRGLRRHRGSDTNSLSPLFVHPGEPTYDLAEYEFS